MEDSNKAMFYKKSANGKLQFCFYDSDATSERDGFYSSSTAHSAPELPSSEQYQFDAKVLSIVFNHRNVWANLQVLNPLV